MCGILGSIPGADDVMFAHALSQLSHRGPDGQKIVSLPGIKLGHTRLKIIDVSSAGDQPMTDETERFHLVFNGEIYNFIEIKKELISLGHRFKSSSDSEVLLRSFIEWREHCLHRLNGMWSFAIWDAKEKSLFLSRDRFGKKPLFYIQEDDRFIFASEMKALTPFLKSVKPSPHFSWMCKNIFDYESTDKCLIEGILRFPAGHFGTFSNGKLTTKRFWNTLDHLCDVPVRYEDQVEQFKEIFKDSCRIRMRADVPVGTALSGGLDSSSTFSMMCNLSPDQKPQGFVASFPNNAIDETHYAKLVLEHCRARGTFITVDPDKALSQLLNQIYLCEEIYLTSPAPMFLTYEAIKRSGVSVTLDGHGADEMFSGYGHLIEAMADVGMSSDGRMSVLQTLDAMSGKSRSYSELQALGYYTRFMIKKGIRELKKTPQKDSDHPNFKNLSHLSRSLYGIFHHSILPTLLRNYDRYSMASGVEIRMPFMDHRLVSYVFSLPSEAKFSHGYSKMILRDAVKDILPHEIAFRKSKIGFNTPSTDWIRGPWNNFIADLIHSNDFKNCSLITDHERLRQDFHNISTSEKTDWLSGEKFWTEFMPFLWEKAMIKGEHK